MDIGWYKDNMALQEELRREYPAVAELIDELEQQLSRYQSKYNNLLAVAHRDGGHYLAQHGEEKAGEAAITAILAAYHSNDRYQGAVEVGGKVYYSGDYCWVESDIFPDGYELPKGRLVTLLVMKEV